MTNREVIEDMLGLCLIRPGEVFRAMLLCLSPALCLSLSLRVTGASLFPSVYVSLSIAMSQVRLTV